MLYWLGPPQALAALESHDQAKPHKVMFDPEFKCRRTVPLGEWFIKRCKFGCMQYVFIKVVCSIATLGLELTERPCPPDVEGEEPRINPCTMFGEGESSNPWVGYPWIMLLTNCSQMVAMYWLVIFYYEFHEELRLLKPFPKFLCVKAVVFMSFWQAVGIAFLVHYGIIHGEEGSKTWSADTVSKQLQDFCIIVEMFIGAIAHHYILSWKEFQEVYDDGKGAFVDENAEDEDAEAEAHQGGEEDLEVGGPLGGGAAAAGSDLELGASSVGSAAEAAGAKEERPHSGGVGVSSSAVAPKKVNIAGPGRAVGVKGGGGTAKDDRGDTSPLVQA